MKLTIILFDYCFKLLISLHRDKDENLVLEYKKSLPCLETGAMGLRLRGRVVVVFQGAKTVVDQEHGI